MTRRGALWVTYAIYITIGFLSAVLGPALDDLAEQVGSTESAIGVLLTANFLGALIAQASVGPLMDRFGPRPLLLAGLALFTLGTSGILLSSGLWMIVVAGVIFGAGFGTLDTGSNVLVAELYTDHNVSVLNSLHLFFGIGSVMSPAIAAQALDWTDSAIPTIWIGLLMLLALWPGILRLPTRVIRSEVEAASVQLGKFSYRNVLLWGLGGILLLYVSSEMGLSAWMTQYVEDSTTLSKVAGARITSIYWLALTVGRLAGIQLGKRLGGERLLLICLAGSLIGSGLLAAGSGIAALTMIGAVVIGFFFGPIYPTVIAVAATLFRNGPGKATSLIAALASLGGMIGPALQGVLLNEVSPISSVIFVIVQCVGMLVLHGALQRQRDVTGVQVGVAS